MNPRLARITDQGDACNAAVLAGPYAETDDCRHRAELADGGGSDPMAEHLRLRSTASLAELLNLPFGA